MRGHYPDWLFENGDDSEAVLDCHVTGMHTGPETINSKKTALTKIVLITNFVNQLLGDTKPPFTE